MFECVVITDPGNVSGNSLVVKLAGSFIERLVLWHWPDDEFFEPGRQGLHRLASCLGLGVYVIDVGGTSWSVILSKDQDCAVVQQFDPLGGPEYTIALVHSEQGKAVVFFIARWYVFPSLLLEFSQFFVELCNGDCILVLLLMVKSVPVPNSLYE